MTTVGAALARVSKRLAAAECESPRVDAEVLLAHVLGRTRSSVLLDADRPLPGDVAADLEGLVARRERREPLAYVLGEWGFRRLTLKVDARVLVPRPETEVVVERSLARIAGLREPRVLDVGTGSGAIALAIADEHPGAIVTGMDASRDALAVAAANAQATGLAVELVELDLFSGLPSGPWDLVVSNPPYVSAQEIEALEPEVRDWEPRAALVGEGATDAIALAARDVLRLGGALVLEVAEGGAGRVAELLRELGYEAVAVGRDLAGRDRVVEGVTTSAD
ncbi:MAG TPA: peptide chain release factor N(5)-glutamine methyltransferase [Gaiellaceae bacterium]|nr:peptide chain release factor N(5)-glutamine methyltransferase [Gaiellaceae bacterium]